MHEPAWAQFATLTAPMLADLRHRQLQITISQRAGFHRRGHH
jgi:hypothetical protein